MNVTYRDKDNGIQAIISYKVNGKWKQKSKQGFTKKTEAKKWANDKMYELMDLEDKNIQETDMTLDELIDEYIKMLKLRGCTENTIKTVCTFKNFMKDFENKSIKDITSYDIEFYFLNKSKKNGHSYSTFLNRLKIVFNFAVKNLQMLSINPANNVKIKKKEDTRIKYVTEELYRKITEEINPKYANVVKVAYNTGMRCGEILGLTNKDIYPDHINVNKQWQHGKFAKLKTENSYRDIPIPLELYKMFQTMPVDINGRFFYDTATATLAVALRRYNTSLHCFRHTYATRLISAGIDLTTVASVIGDNMDTIIKVYTEINKDVKEKESDKIRRMVL